MWDNFLKRLHGPENTRREKEEQDRKELRELLEEELEIINKNNNLKYTLRCEDNIGSMVYQVFGSASKREEAAFFRLTPRILHYDIKDNNLNSLEEKVKAYCDKHQLGYKADRGGFLTTSS